MWYAVFGIIYWSGQYVPGRVVVVSLNNKKTLMSDQKPPFVFNNYLHLHLFKLTAASPQINSCPMQKQKMPRDNICCFYVLFCLPSFACTFSLSVVLRDCQCENTWPFTILAGSGKPCFLSILHTEHMHWHLSWGEWRFSSQFSLHF